MADGRMLSKRVTRSDKVSALSSDTARMIYSWLIPYTDVEGRMEANPRLLKGDIAPLLDHITPSVINDVLCELHEIGLIILYSSDEAKQYLQITQFEDNQKNLRKDREAPSRIPPPVADKVRINSGVSPEEVPPKIKINKSLRESLREENPYLSETEKIVSDGNGKYPPCPQSEIVNLYHKTLPELPRVKHWPENLQVILRTRWKEDRARQNLAWWEQFYRYVHESDFLMGRTKEAFVADLEWLVRPKNFTKIANGRYHGRGNLSAKPQPGISAWLAGRRENAAAG